MDPPLGLLEKVLGKVRAAQMRKLRVHLGLALIGVMGSILYVAWNWSVILSEVRQTPFFPLLLLVDSDSDIMFANGKDLVFGLLETIPIES